MKIFWSWQSDTHGQTGRHFVKAAMLAAIERLKEAEDVEEPSERDTLHDLHLDQDRQGLSGSPDLAAAILRKIAAANVVIADVTIVHRAKGTRQEGKLIKGRSFINPNVAIELGYALKAIGDANVLMVMNTFYGNRDELPFDLRHKAGPIQYNLSPEAGSGAVAAEQKKLVPVFVEALKPFIAKVASNKRQKVEVKRWPAKRDPAFFFEQDEVLAAVGKPGVDEVRFGMTSKRAAYLRVTPLQTFSRPLLPRQLQELTAASTDLLFQLKPASGMQRLNRYGSILFEPITHTKPFNEVNALTQVFPTGEIWGINPWLFRDRFDLDLGPIIAAFPFESIFFDAINRFLRFSGRRLNLKPPYEIEAGVVGAHGYRIAFENLETVGPIHGDTIHHKDIINSNDPNEIAQFLLSFFETVYDHTPYARPQNLFGFPPGPLSPDRGPR